MIGIVRRIAALLLLSGALAGAAAAERHEAEGADAPVLTLIVPAGAGGGTDGVARRLASLLGEPLGMPVVVVNRPGNGGAAALEALASAPPDGLTLLVLTGAALEAAGGASAPPFTPLLLFNLDPPALHVGAGDDPEQRLAAVLAGRAAASGGPAGSLPHLALGHLAATRGARLGPAAWRPAPDAARALEDLAGGEVALVVASAPEAAAGRRAGEVETLLDAGAASGLATSLGGWRGLVAPAGLSRQQAEALLGAARAAAGSTAFREFLHLRGYGAADLGPAAFEDFLDAFGAALGRARDGLP